jgi:ferrochelatase
VLSPLESPASFGKYTEKASQARREADALSIDVVYAGPFHNNAQFLAAQAGRAEEALHSLNGDAPQRTFILFSAHSIPVKMSEESGYASQFSAAAAAVARKLGYPSWGTAYQSRSGGPREPWLGPDVKEAVAAIDRKIFRNVAVVPIGFVSDNAEVLYDLDIELKGVVEGLGLRYIRASTAMDDPRFIAMMGQCVLRNLEEKG